jgi:hypothetical protein
MNIYVQSRGYDQDKDYCWIQTIADGTVQAEIPPLSKNAISLLETSFPSVLLERLLDERLLLLITGLEPENSFDIINRQIRIDLAFVVPNTDENESLLRQLAARALREKKLQLLTAEVSQAVQLLKDPDFLQVYPEDRERIKAAFEESDFNNQQELAVELNLPEEIVHKFCEGKPVKYQDFVEIDKKLELSLARAKEIYSPPDCQLSPEEENIYTNFVEFGFYVSVEKLLAIVSAERGAEVLPSEAPDLTNKVALNSPELKEQLADELTRCKLPLDMKPLVVATGFKKLETFVEAQTWRGLSKLVETEEWMEITPVQPQSRFSLSMLSEIVSSWLKYFSALISANVDGTEISEDRTKEDNHSEKL